MSKLLAMMKNKEKLNALIMGSLNITNDFVVSGFYANRGIHVEDLVNYLKLPSFEFDNTKSWEIQIAFSTTLNNTRQIFLGMPVDYTFPTMWVKNDCLYGEIPSESRSGWDIGSESSGYVSININTKYYSKLSYDGDITYKFQYSLDGVSFSDIWTTVSSGKVSLPIEVFLGVTWFNNDSNANYLRGNIYMKDCYIKNNGVFIWKGVK